MEGIKCSSVDIFSLRLDVFLKKVNFCITALMVSLETTLNASFQVEWGQSYKPAVLTAANFGLDESWCT